MRYGPSLFHKPNPIHKRGVRNLWHTFNQLGSPRLIYIYIYIYISSSQPWLLGLDPTRE